MTMVDKKVFILILRHKQLEAIHYNKYNQKIRRIVKHIYIDFSYHNKKVNVLWLEKTAKTRRTQAINRQEPTK